MWLRRLFGERRAEPSTHPAAKPIAPEPQAPAQTLPPPPTAAPVASLPSVYGYACRIAYQDVDGVYTERDVRCLDMRRHERGMTLRAICFLRNDVRNFRVDRIIHVEESGGGALLGRGSVFFADFQAVDAPMWPEGDV